MTMLTRTDKYAVKSVTSQEQGEADAEFAIDGDPAPSGTPNITRP